ncbi:MAG: hypothetical protein JNJ61_10805 [Anaerolineae bacterium]|nr:hypothetical protein [Anaerolineae bacterium]
MSEPQTTIRETKMHWLKGKFPSVDTYPHINTDLLYENDASPFHITLAVAEVGATSHNGLIYDQELVDSIAKQLSEGAEGLRGHPSETEATGFPVADVFWIGHVQESGVLWAKGYIPPGERREDVRRRMATNSAVGTSIYGTATKTPVSEAGKKRSNRWYAKNFVLEQIDLLHGRKASLPVGRKYGAMITAEHRQEEIMPDNDITLADVPQHIREQIINEAALSTRVSELQAENTTLRAQVEEAISYKQIVAEIRATIGKDTDTVQIVQQYHTMATTLAETMGVPFTDITIRVSELHEQVAEARRTAFDAAVTEAISKRTAWPLITEGSKRQVEALRTGLRRSLSQALAGDLDTSKIEEALNKLWDDEYSVLAEGIVRSAGGPAAITPPRDSKTAPNADQMIEEARKSDLVPSPLQ